MNGFEEFINFLTAKGVKSFHIELYGNTLSAQVLPDPSPITVPVRKHDIPVHRGVEAEIVSATRFPSLAPCVSESAAALSSPILAYHEVHKTDEERHCDDAMTPLKTPADVPPIAQVEEKAKMDSAPQLVKPMQEKPYEAFCDSVNKDDGAVTKDDRLALIDAMGLDDLLRVNNDFQLGLDTDKPVEAVREDVKECF